MTTHNELFNKKTIERLCKDVKITNKQKQATTEWLQLLADNKLTDEKSNYPKFMQIVLQDILGYPIKEIDFETDNVEFQFSNSEKKKILCFEAKGTSTKDLFAPQHRTKKEHETPIKQTWDYIGSIGLDYGICTNYKEFVLITKQFGYSTYHIFDFNSIKKNEDKLKEFIAIFSKERIIDIGFVEKLHSESVTEEKEFTKEFYKLFHETRLMLIKAFQDKEDVTKGDAIYYTQIFLNRLIFIFFVEDRGYLSDNRLFSNRLLKLIDAGQSTEHSRKIYDEISELFIAFDKGSHQLGVFGFNGGLFSGVIPNKIYFSDLRDPAFFAKVRQHSKLLKTTKLNKTASEIISKYQNQLNPIISNLLILDSFDFKDEVNVDILGHIFEQSITDLEGLKEEKISRRKKEGVYYTPEYITNYICRNTIIPYLSKTNVSTTHELIEEYIDNIEELENKFKEIKIVDPACGSGAFLIKSIDILLEIHKQIQLVKESSGKYSIGEQTQLTKWNEETEIRIIIENNIYGVDINRESVEITQLSLFLKLASNNRKLIGLSKNIKVGNSLIEDNAVDEKAFSWKNEFPEVMEFGKFDVVVGNPPYVRQELFKEIKPFLKKEYQSYSSLADLYVYFVEKGINLLKEKGKLAFIFPNKFMKTEYGKNLRKFLIDNVKIQILYDFDDYRVFEDVTTYPIIFILEKNDDVEHNEIRFSKLKNKKIDFPLLSFKENEQLVPQSELTTDFWVFTSPEVSKILNKIEKNSISLKEFVDDKIFRGISSGKNDAFIVNQKKYDELIKDPKAKQVLKKIVTGSEVKRYRIDFENQYLLFIPWEYDLEYSSTIKHHLLEHKSELEKRPEVIEGRFDWWVLSRYGSKNAEYLSKSKIIYPRITNQSNFCLDESGEMYLSDNNFFISSDSKSLLAILNSSLIFFFLKQISSTLRGGFRDFRRPYIEKIPINKALMDHDKELSKKATEILKANNDFLLKQNKFLSRVISKFSPLKISKKIDSIIDLEFSDFFNEIKKLSPVKLTLKEQEDWEEYFVERQKELELLQDKIIKLEQEINEIVFDLYGLSQNERKIVSRNVENVRLVN